MAFAHGYSCIISSAIGLLCMLSTGCWFQTSLTKFVFVYWYCSRDYLLFLFCVPVFVLKLILYFPMYWNGTWLTSPFGLARIHFFNIFLVEIFVERYKVLGTSLFFNLLCFYLLPCFDKKVDRFTVAVPISPFCWRLAVVPTYIPF